MFALIFGVNLNFGVVDLLFVVELDLLGGFHMFSPVVMQIDDYR